MTIANSAVTDLPDADDRRDHLVLLDQPRVVERAVGAADDEQRRQLQRAEDVRRSATARRAQRPSTRPDGNASSRWISTEMVTASSARPIASSAGSSKNCSPLNATSHADEHHQRARAVLRAPQPGERADGDEAPDEHDTDVRDRLCRRAALARARASRSAARRRSRARTGRLRRSPAHVQSEPTAARGPRRARRPASAARRRRSGPRRSSSAPTGSSRASASATARPARTRATASRT